MEGDFLSIKPRDFIPEGQFASPLKHGDKDNIREAADNVERYFIGYLLDVMFENVPMSDLFGGEEAGTFFRGELMHAYSKDMVGMLGIADRIYNEFKRKKENKEDLNNNIVFNNIKEAYHGPTDPINVYDVHV